MLQYLRQYIGGMELWAEANHAPEISIFYRNNTGIGVFNANLVKIEFRRQPAMKVNAKLLQILQQ